MKSPNHQTKYSISRRQFLQIATGVAVSALSVQQHRSFAANSAQIGTIPRPAYGEAPMLANLVAQGKLLPVDQRLPTLPGVIPTIESTGTYGDVIRRVHKGIADRFGPTKMVDHGLVWFNKDLGLRAHLAEEWQVNTDATEWTFTLRAGMKWSDGRPFTTADIQWWYEHELTNTELMPTPPGIFTTGTNRTLMQLLVVDAQTVTFRFANSYPLFPYQLARPGTAPYVPSHYLIQFHIDTTDDPAALQQQSQQAGFESWVAYYHDRNAWHLNPDRPSLAPWLAKNALAASTFIMERNPYFFGVDSTNQQLPYVDRVVHEYAPLDRLVDQLAITGNLDFQARHIGNSQLAYYQQQASAGDYQVITAVSASHVALQLNLTTSDPQLRAFFQDQRVRVALSLAVDRATLNQQIYGGIATPRQYSPLPQSPEFHAALSNAHIGYDVSQANNLLDRAGYGAKDGQGFRLWPTGNGGRIRFTIEGTVEIGSTDAAALQLVLQYFAAVGIEATYQSVNRGLYETHINSNQIEAAWWGGDRTILPLLDPGIFLGVILDRPWAVAWGIWRQNPNASNAEAPPTGHWIRDIWAIWDQIVGETESTEQTRLLKQILDIWARELPMIGLLGEFPAPVIKRNGLRNYVGNYSLDNTTGDEHLLNPETLFWDAPKPMVMLNYNTGQPGSYFILTANNFPANQSATISVNNVSISTVTTDAAGTVAATLDTRELPLGDYVVKISVNPEASFPLIIESDQPLRAKESEQQPILIPKVVAQKTVYLPLIER